MLLAHFLEPGREVRRHRDEAAFALHGLEHDARDGGGVDVLLEEVRQRFERVVRRDASIRIRRG